MKHIVLKNLHYLDAACDKNQLSENDIAWTKDENIKHLIEHADSEIASLQVVWINLKVQMKIVK